MPIAAAPWHEPHHLGEGSSLFVESLTVAFMAMGELIIVTATGMLANKLGYLEGYTMRGLSRLLLKLLMPALILSLFHAFTFARLVQWLCVPLWALLHIAVGAAIGVVGARLLRLHPPHSALLVLSVAFGNCGGLPFLLAAPLVANWRRVAGLEEPLGRANAIVGMYAER